MSNEAEKEEVGYGRPPRHTQFKKGQSGNPAGRPRRHAPEVLDVAAVLAEPVIVESKGRKRPMSPFEIATRQLVKKALKQQCLSAALSFLRLCEDYAIIAPRPAPTRRHVLQVPRSWDWDEWLAMLEQHGPPPWKGPRSGLPEPRATSSQEADR